VRTSREGVHLRVLAVRGSKKRTGKADGAVLSELLGKRVGERTAVLLGPGLGGLTSRFSFDVSSELK